MNVSMTVSMDYQHLDMDLWRAKLVQRLSENQEAKTKCIKLFLKIIFVYEIICEYVVMTAIVY